MENWEALYPLNEAVNTRSYVKISPSQANRILSLIRELEAEIARMELKP